jgi:hypothetical protein
MNDATHLFREKGESNSEAHAINRDSNPQQSEGEAILARMKYISNLIAHVIIFSPFEFRSNF